MRKLKVFWRTFIKSLTKPSYYKEVVSAPFFFSLKYLFSLLFLSSLVFGIQLAIVISAGLPKIPGFVENTKREVLAVYPEELVLTLKDKKVSTNVSEPYYIKPLEGSDRFSHLGVIDTKGSASDYPTYNSVFLLTEDTVAFYDDEIGYRVVPLVDFLSDAPEGLQITKNSYDAFAKSILPYLDHLPTLARWGILIVLTVFPLLIALLDISWKLLYLLVLTVLLYAVARIMKKKTTYSGLYKISMHALTVPVVLSLVLSLLGLNIPFIFILSFFVWAVIILKEI